MAVMACPAAGLTPGTALVGGSYVHVQCVVADNRMCSRVDNL